MEQPFPVQRSRLFPWVIGLTILLAILLSILVIWQGMSEPVTSMDRNAMEVVQGSVTIQSDQGAILALDHTNARLYIPCCVFGVGGQLQMLVQPPDLFLPAVADTEWQRSQVVNIEYINRDGNLVPGAYSSTPVELCFFLTDEEWQRYLARPRDFQIQVFNTQMTPNEWRPLKMKALEHSHELCGQINHLSVFALAVRGEQLPITGGEAIYQP